MRHNPPHNEKLTQVIHLALNYQNHRKSLQHIKPTLQIPTLKKIQLNESLKLNRIKYAQQSRQSKSNSIQQDNHLQVSRILNTKSTLKHFNTKSILKHIHPSSIVKRIVHNPQNNANLSASRTRTSQRPSSNRSISSNFGTRSRRQKQINQENKEIAKRVQHPKMSKHMNNSYFDKQFMKQQQYLRIRSRFSERSKSILQSLTLDGLKMSKKDLGFLPQIGSRMNTSKNSNYNTIATSRTSLQTSKREKQQKNKAHQTIQFLNNIPKNQKTKNRYCF